MEQLKFNLQNPAPMGALNILNSLGSKENVINTAKKGYKQDTVIKAALKYKFVSHLFLPSVEHVFSSYLDIEKILGSKANNISQIIKIFEQKIYNYVDNDTVETLWDRVEAVAKPLFTETLGIELKKNVDELNQIIQKQKSLLLNEKIEGFSMLENPVFLDILQFLTNEKSNIDLLARNITLRILNKGSTNINDN